MPDADLKIGGKLLASAAADALEAGDIEALRKHEPDFKWRLGADGGIYGRARTELEKGADE